MQAVIMNPNAYACDWFLILSLMLWCRVRSRVGQALGRNKMVDLDTLTIKEIAWNSSTKAAVDSNDVPVFLYNHVLKLQVNLQVKNISHRQQLKFGNWYLLPFYVHLLIQDI